KLPCKLDGSTSGLACSRFALALATRVIFSSLPLRSTTQPSAKCGTARRATVLRDPGDGEGEHQRAERASEREEGDRVGRRAKLVGKIERLASGGAAP